jgi:hypothetical protein
MIRFVSEDRCRHQEASVGVYVGQVVTKQRDVGRPLIIQRDNLDIADVAGAMLTSLMRLPFVMGGSLVIAENWYRLDVNVNAVRAVEQSVR